MAMFLKATTKARNGDDDFEPLWGEYKETITRMKELEATMKAHLATTSKYVASCAQLSVQLASFFHQSDEKVSKRFVEFGKAHAEIERVQLKSIEKLYNQEVLQPMEAVWVSDVEIHKGVKHRKKLIANENKKLKALIAKEEEVKYWSTVAAREKATGKPYKPNLVGKKKRDVSEVSREKEAKAQEYQESKRLQESVTKALKLKFEQIKNSRISGELLASPISAVVASQMHLHSQSTQRLSKAKRKFVAHDVYQRTLDRFDANVIAGKALQKDVLNSKGFVFGRTLTSKTPGVVCDSIKYIRCGIRAEGLFRIPGNRNLVEEIQSKYDANNSNALNEMTNIDIHDVCSLLKYYFNCLPEALIPYHIYDELEVYFRENNSGGLSDHEIIRIVQKTPPIRIAVLGMMLNFLHDIAKQSKYNQMNHANLATCFAPVLLKPEPGQDRMKTNFRSMQNMGANIRTMTILIEQARQFAVPSESAVSKCVSLTPETVERVKATYKNTQGLHNDAMINNANDPNHNPTQAVRPPRPGDNQQIMQTLHRAAKSSRAVSTRGVSPDAPPGDMGNGDMARLQNTLAQAQKVQGNSPSPPGLMGRAGRSNSQMASLRAGHAFSAKDMELLMTGSQADRIKVLASDGQGTGRRLVIRRESSELPAAAAPAPPPKALRVQASDDVDKKEFDV